jgi:hypothetical protein
MAPGQFAKGNLQSSTLALAACLRTQPSLPPRQSRFDARGAGNFNPYIGSPSTLMKLFPLLAVVALLSTCLMAGADAGAAQANPMRGDVVHVVSFKFKETASPADIRKVEQAFAALPGKISHIATYEWGTNISPENLNKDFTHAFVLTFHSTRERDAYLVHPDHKQFATLIGPYIADVFVIDFKVRTAEGERRTP